VKFQDGVLPVSRTVFPTFLNPRLLTRCYMFNPHLWRAPNLTHCSHNPIWLYGVPGCVQQTGSHEFTTPSAMGLCHRPAAWCHTPQGASVPPIHSGTQGYGGLNNNNGSFVHLPHQRHQASSSSFWVRRTEACSPVSTTGPSTNTPSSSFTLFPWSRLPLMNSVGPASSRSWICGAPITSFVSGRAMSGKQLSSPLPATMSIRLCRMAWPTHRPSSRGL